jgi:hypothetical protein
LPRNRDEERTIAYSEKALEYLLGWAKWKLSHDTPVSGQLYRHYVNLGKNLSQRDLETMDGKRHWEYMESLRPFLQTRPNYEATLARMKELGV